MIVSLSRYTSRLAVALESPADNARLMDWRHLQLLVMPPPPPKGVPGSPWFLWGCWPFHPTGVDMSNPPRPDFPVICIDAFDCDTEGRIVFILDRRIHDLKPGRYQGEIRVHPHAAPINLPEQKFHVRTLYRFDIDLGPECAEHIVSQCVINFRRETP